MVQSFYVVLLVKRYTWFTGNGWHEMVPQCGFIALPYSNSGAQPPHPTELVLETTITSLVQKLKELVCRVFVMALLSLFSHCFEVVRGKQPLEPYGDIQPKLELLQNEPYSRVTSPRRRHRRKTQNLI